MARPAFKRLLQIFTWWNSTTLGTSFTTWLRGEAVGEDEFGNRYFRTKDGKIDPALGHDRRWVIYHGVTDPTSIPPGWYRWIHHLSDEIPDGSYVPREWQEPHRPNPTGTAAAHRPQGSILRPDPQAGIAKGYDAWTPD
ncbi:MAG: NADH:ubiquinone oxidoreductase subunit NDUFA12 [Pseudomonadota bacterium]